MPTSVKMINIREENTDNALNKCDMLVYSSLYLSPLVSNLHDHFFNEIFLIEVFL